MVRHIYSGAADASLPAVTTSPQSWGDPGTAANEEQSITITGSPTGGTFTLTYAGSTTAAIDFDATAAEVESALEAIASIGEGNVSVTGEAGGPWTAEFINDLGYQSLAAMTADGALLTGGSSPDVEIAEVEDGSPGGGTWNLLPTDADKDVKIARDVVTTFIRPHGASRPTVKHSLISADKSVTFTLTEVTEARMALLFPNLDLTSHVLTRNVKGVQQTPIALGIETDVSVRYYPRCVIDEESETTITDADVERPEVTFEFLEDASGVVGEEHFFTG